MQSHDMVLQAPPRPHPPSNNVIIVFFGGGGGGETTMTLPFGSMYIRHLEKVVNVTNYTRLGYA